MDDKQVVYANSLEANVQLFDAQLTFKQELADGTHTNETIIAMSPQHLKVVNKILTLAIEKYEEQFGEINIPENTGTKEMEE